MSNPNIITESMLLDNIDKGIFDETLVGKSVELAEGSYRHEWKIIRVNSDSYDLWYNDWVDMARWSLSEDTVVSWTDTSTSGNTVRASCTYYKSKLSSSIQSRLKPGLNVNCGDDLIVILYAKQLGYTDSDITNDDNIAIPYFNSKSKRDIDDSYWTSSARLTKSNNLWRVRSNGVFNGNYRVFDSVVPAIRVGEIFQQHQNDLLNMKLYQQLLLNKFIMEG